jgi:propanediol utilization protein
LTEGGALHIVAVVTSPVRKPHAPRFVRLSAADAAALFGDQPLEPRFTISGGRFVARQRVAVVGTRGRIDGVPVVGPPVEETTISWSDGDADKLGLDDNSAAGVILVGTAGELKLQS